MMMSVRKIMLVILVILLTGCKSTETVSEDADTTKSVHIENVNGVKVSSSEILRNHWAERIYSITINEKGDTVREKELVYIDNSNVEIYRDSIDRMREIIDSLVNIKSKYIRYTVKEKLPWYRELMMYYSAFVVIALLAIIVVLFLYIRYLLRNKEKK